MNTAEINQQSYGGAFLISFEYKIVRFCWSSYQTLGLFYIRSVKLRYVEETHVMLVAFRRCENCCSSPAQKIL